MKEKNNSDLKNGGNLITWEILRNDRKEHGTIFYIALLFFMAVLLLFSVSTLTVVVAVVYALASPSLFKTNKGMCLQQVVSACFLGQNFYCKEFPTPCQVPPLWNTEKKPQA